MIFIKIVDADQDSFKDIEGEADTLAGLILEIKGELPEKNEVITYQGHQFTILEVDNRRIKKIKYEKKYSLLSLEKKDSPLLKIFIAGENML